MRYVAVITLRFLCTNTPLPTLLLVFLGFDDAPHCCHCLHIVCYSAFYWQFAAISYQDMSYDKELCGLRVIWNGVPVLSIQTLFVQVTWEWDIIFNKIIKAIFNTSICLVVAELLVRMFIYLRGFQLTKATQDPICSLPLSKCISHRQCVKHTQWSAMAFLVYVCLYAHIHSCAKIFSHLLISTHSLMIIFMIIVIFISTTRFGDIWYNGVIAHFDTYLLKHV